MGAQHHKIAYITGSSKGIGEALVKKLIDHNYFVIGLSRSNEFEHDNFRFVQIDLSNLSEVEEFEFSEEAEEVVLVNNAGLIGEIGAVGTVGNESIQQVMNVNTIAPQILCNNFMAHFSSSKNKFHILNISSGAGKKAIESWATYCASKAAIDLFSETVSAEMEWKNMENWCIHSCAPGVVDTQMQVDIRSADVSKFMHVNNFKDYKQNGDLYSPDHVANKLFEVISQPKKFPEVILSVRDF